MQRVSFILKVKPGKVEEYRRLHRDVWPEMREALSRHGWHNYSLFLRDDGTLVGYVETPDFPKAVAGMQGEPVNARWQERVKDLFEELPGGAADTSMRPLEPVFFLP